MNRLNHRTRTVCQTITLITVFFLIYIAGLFIPDDAIHTSFLNAKRPPSLEHLFGTDAVGRDLFLRTIKGLSTSITIGLIASFVSAVIATLIGMSAAIGSKKLDTLISRIIDLTMSVPHTILIILISFSFGCGLKGILIGIAATHWCSLARLIRAEVLSLRAEPYIAVSRKLGKSNRWILQNHLLPHLIPQFIVGLILMFPHAILHEASVSFLGFGLPPEEAAIGIILSESMRYLSAGMWWTALLPGAVLVLLVLLIDKIGDSLRVLLDPYSAQK